jgi:pyruvate/2-oxoglutarate/acetoin dehydrogenase E1 component
MRQRQISYREAINEALREEMERDPNVILLGEDIAGGAQNTKPEMVDSWGGVLGVTKGLIGRFGRERVLDTPISESAIIGAATGAAAAGLRPVAELMFVGFVGVCLDQIVNQAAKLRYMFGGKAKVPLTIRTTIGAGMGAAAQHSDTLYSIFAHYPGLKCVVPATPADAKGLLKAAIRDDDPVVFFENKVLYDLKGLVPEGEHLIPIGKGRIVREGTDVTIVALSRMVHVALKAADILAAEGINVEIVDPRSISPLDEHLILESVRKTERLIVVDEDHPRCSMATDIVALVTTKAFDYLDAAPIMVTPPHTPVPFSPPLEKFYIPSEDRIIEAVRRAMPVCV